MRDPRNTLFTVPALYGSTPRAMTGKEIIEAILSVEEKVCTYYATAIQQVQPTDSFGYPILHSQKELEGWRRYQISRMCFIFKDLKKMSDDVS